MHEITKMAIEAVYELHRKKCDKNLDEMTEQEGKELLQELGKKFGIGRYGKKRRKLFSKYNLIERIKYFLEV